MFNRVLEAKKKFDEFKVTDKIAEIKTEIKEEVDEALDKGREGCLLPHCTALHCTVALLSD